MTEEFCEHFTGVEVLHYRSLRHPYFDRRTAFAVKVFTFSVNSIGRPSVWVVSKWKKGCNVMISD